MGAAMGAAWLTRPRGFICPSSEHCCGSLETPPTVTPGQDSLHGTQHTRLQPQEGTAGTVLYDRARPSESVLAITRLAAHGGGPSGGPRPGEALGTVAQTLQLLIRV